MDRAFLGGVVTCIFVIIMSSIGTFILKMILPTSVWEKSNKFVISGMGFLLMIALAFLYDYMFSDYPIISF